MAMGNYCYAQGIECHYATAYGQCQDDIYEDFGICEMLGDEMPPKELPETYRREWCMKGCRKDNVPRGDKHGDK